MNQDDLLVEPALIFPESAQYAEVMRSTTPALEICMPVKICCEYAIREAKDESR